MSTPTVIHRQILLPTSAQARFYGRSMGELREPPESMTIAEAMRRRLDHFRRTDPFYATYVGEGYESAIAAFRKHEVSSKHLESTGVIAAGTESIVLGLTHYLQRVVKISIGDNRIDGYVRQSVPVRDRYSFNVPILEEADISVVASANLHSVLRRTYFTIRPKGVADSSWKAAHQFYHQNILSQGLIYWDPGWGTCPVQLVKIDGKFLMADDNAVCRKIKYFHGTDLRRLNRAIEDWMQYRMKLAGTL